MTNLPEGLQYLMSATSLSVESEWACFKNEYSVSIPNGIILTVKGNTKYVMKDNNKDIVAEMKYPSAWFSTPKLKVYVYGHSSPYLVQPNGSWSRSLLITDEQDGVLLKLQCPQAFSFSTKYQIMGVDGINGEYIPIGHIKSNWSDYEIVFPQDLDLRCKVALISSAIYMADMRRRRNAAR